MKERTNYQIRSRSFGLSPRYRSALQSSRFVGGYDLNVEFGNMNLWDDPRIVLEAAECAITLFVHAANGEKLELNKARAMFANIANVLARCYVRSIEANVEKEIEEKKKESEGYYDDPNM